MALSSSVLPAVRSFLALPSQLTDKPLAQAMSKQGVEGGRGIRGLRGDRQGWGGGKGPCSTAVLELHCSWNLILH